MPFGSSGLQGVGRGGRKVFDEVWATEFKAKSLQLNRIGNVTTTMQLTQKFWLHIS